MKIFGENSRLPKFGQKVPKMDFFTFSQNPISFFPILCLKLKAKN